MTQDEFAAEMVTLDSGFPGLRGLSQDERSLRHQSVWDVVKEFTAEEFKRATVALRESRNEFPPSVTEIYDACLDAAESAQRTRTPRQRPLHPHKCNGANPDKTPALDALIIFPYEHAHIACPGKISATCPTCGKQHFNTEILETFSHAFLPEQTSQWNYHWKGWLFCSRCTNAAKP